MYVMILRQEMKTAADIDICKKILTLIPLLVRNRISIWNDCLSVLNSVLRSCAYVPDAGDVVRGVLAGINVEASKALQSLISEVLSQKVEELTQERVGVISGLLWLYEQKNEVYENIILALEDIAARGEKEAAEEASGILKYNLSPESTWININGMCNEMIEAIALDRFYDAGKITRCLNILESFLSRESVELTKCKLIVFSIKNIGKKYPDLLGSGSLCKFISELPENSLLLNHPWLHYGIFSNVKFNEIAEREKLDETTRYSVALSVFRMLKDGGVNMNNENIAKAAELVLVSRQAYSKSELFSANRGLISIYHEEKDFDPEKSLSVLRPVGASPAKVYKALPSVNKVVEVKRQALRDIAGIGEGAVKGPFTVYFDGHGGNNHIWLTRGNSGDQNSEEMDNPKAISYEELGDALITRFGNQNMSDAALVIDSCYSYNFCRNVLNYLSSKGVKRLPITIAVSNYDRTAYKGKFFEAVEKEVTEPGQAITVDTMFKAEKHAFDYQDMAVLLPDPGWVKETFGQTIGKRGTGTAKRSPKKAALVGGRYVVMAGPVENDGTTSYSSLGPGAVNAGLFGQPTQEGFNDRGGNVKGSEVENLVRLVEPIIDSFKMPPIGEKLDLKERGIDVIVEADESIAALFSNVKDAGRNVVKINRKIIRRDFPGSDTEAIALAIAVHEIADVVGAAFGLNNNTRHTASLELNGLIAQKFPVIRESLAKLWRTEPVAYGKGDRAGAAASAQADLTVLLERNNIPKEIKDSIIRYFGDLEGAAYKDDQEKDKVMVAAKEILGYIAGVYGAAKNVIDNYPCKISEKRNIVIPISDDFLPLAPGVGKTKVQTLWKELRLMLNRDKHFNVNLLTYDGTENDLQTILDKLRGAGGIDESNTIAFMNTALYNEKTAKGYQEKYKITFFGDQLPKGDKGVVPGRLAIGGHIALGLGILAMVEQKWENVEYGNDIRNLITALNDNKANPYTADMADTKNFIEALKNGKIYITLPPIGKIDIEGNMKEHFFMEAAVARSL
ncbi:MAG: hypothetical protein HQL28_03350 [Candidatus Omnitrophica bacterium]|nr:hypothetical protein [Candidatus Omnitrophota bacterium]